MIKLLLGSYVLAGLLKTMTDLKDENENLKKQLKEKEK